MALGSWLAPVMALPIAAGLAVAASRWRWPWLLLLVGLAIGIFRIAGAPITPPPGDLSERAGRTVTGTGVVASYPEPGSGRQRAVVEVESKDQRGKVYVYADPYPELKPGDVLTLKGKLQRPEPFDGFDYPKYLGKDGIYSVMYKPKFTIVGHRNTLNGLVYPARHAFLEKLSATFNEPAAGFLAAILVGDRTGLPDSIVAAFRKTGTIHVMALSGYNISILVAALVAILGRRRRVIWLVFVLIAAFVIFVGPSASVVRAALMGSFMLFGQVLGRPQEAVLACVVTAAGMLLAQPWALRYDLGFDLSFLATIGILLFEPAITARLSRLPEVIRDIVSPTIAASVPAMPLIAATFGTVSLISPVANIAIVPLVPWLMLGGFVATLAAFVSTGLAAVVAAVVQTVTDLALGVVERLSEYPLAFWQLGAWRGAFVAVSGLACGWLTLRIRKSADA